MLDALDVGGAPVQRALSTAMRAWAQAPVPAAASPLTEAVRAMRAAMGAGTHGTEAALLLCALEAADRERVGHEIHGALVQLLPQCHAPSLVIPGLMPPDAVAYPHMGSFQLQDRERLVRDACMGAGATVFRAECGPLAQPRCTWYLHASHAAQRPGERIVTGRLTAASRVGALLHEADGAPYIVASGVDVRPGCQPHPTPCSAPADNYRRSAAAFTRLTLGAGDWGWGA